MAGRNAEDVTLKLKRQLPQADERKPPKFETVEISPRDLGEYLAKGWHQPDPEILDPEDES